jgi:hypothetical protein
MKKKIIISIFLSIAFFYATAQLTISPELKTALQNKNSFKEVMQTVTDYYVQNGYTKNPQLFSEFKKWNRWAWYESRHLDASGNFVNSNKKNEPVLSALIQVKQEANVINGPASNTGVWTSFGPGNVNNGIGRVDRIAFHPANANIIYAGATAGGLWRTVDEGTSWQALNGYIPQLGVSGIVVDADNPNTLYVLSGDGDSFANGGFIYQRRSIGILKSTDGGNSWFKLSNILPDGIIFYGFKLIQSPDFHNRFFACTSNGLYRSIDYGQTWSQDATIGANTVFDIETVPNSGFVYACTQKDVYVSANWGNPFTKVSAGAFSQQPTAFTQRTALAISPNSPTTLYVLFGGSYSPPNTANNVKLLYRSNDNGTTYTLVNNNAPVTSGYASTMAVNPANINNVIIGNVSVLSSNDGGVTFPNTGSGVHDDFHDLSYNPLNNLLYAGCDGGVYRSISNGANWSNRYNGLNITQYYHMAGFEGNDGLALAGAQDNGVHLRNGSNTFTSVNGGDGFDAKFLNGNSNIAYYSLNAAVFKYTVNTNLSQQRLVLGTGINDQNFFYPSIAIHPTNNNIIYAGYISGVWRSDNDGLLWTNLFQSGSAGFAAAGGLAVSANVPDRIYAANGTTLQMSNNRGTIWKTISGNTGWPGGALTITDVQTRNNNANEVWVTFGGYGTAKIVYSSNAGASWVDYTASLPDLPVYCVEYTNDGDVYIGTDAGVYFMDFNMNDWVFFSNGLPMVPVTEVFVNETNGTIKAATFGRGIWQSDLYSDCGPFMLLDGVTQGANFYQSGGFIETKQQIPGSYGNSVKYRSPTKIILKAGLPGQPGFSIKNGAYMHAVIGNCGQGIFNRADSSGTVISKEEYLKMNMQMRE